MPRPIQSRAARWIKSLLKENKVPEKDRKGRKGFEGFVTKLPMNRWFEAIFELNELRALQRILDPSKKPLTDDQILYNWSQEFQRERHIKLSTGRQILPEVQSQVGSGVLECCAINTANP